MPKLRLWINFRCEFSKCRPLAGVHQRISKVKVNSGEGRNQILLVPLSSKNCSLSLLGGADDLRTLAWTRTKTMPKGQNQSRLEILCGLGAKSFKIRQEMAQISANSLSPWLGLAPCLSKCPYSFYKLGPNEY